MARKLPAEFVADVATAKLFDQRLALIGADSDGSYEPPLHKELPRLSDREYAELAKICAREHGRDGGVGFFTPQIGYSPASASKGLTAAVDFARLAISGTWPKAQSVALQGANDSPPLTPAWVMHLLPKC